MSAHIREAAGLPLIAQFQARVAENACRAGVYSSVASTNWRRQL